MTYQNRIFCDTRSCVTPWCGHRLTDDMYDEAKKWWASMGQPGLPPIETRDMRFTCKDFRLAKK